MLEQLTVDYKEAFMNKEAVKKTALNMVLAQAKNKKIDLGRELEDEEVVSLVKKEVKSIKEAMTYLEKANKPLDEEEEKLSALEKYLPQMMNEEDTRVVVEKLISDLDISDVHAERGKLMGAIMGQYKGQIDGTVVNKILSEK